MKDQEEDGSISSNLFKNKIQLFFPRVGVSEHKQVNHTREELQWQALRMQIEVLSIYSGNLCLAGLLLINPYLNF